MTAAIPRPPGGDGPDLADDALDTLGSVLQSFGDDSFRIDADVDAEHFRQRCAAILRHVENGAPVEDLDIGQDVSGRRDWRAVRRFFGERRKQERDFVESTMDDYRGAVEDLVSGLRDICRHTDRTEETVTASLEAILGIVDGGEYGDIKRALAGALSTVNDAFARQRDHYEAQISNLQVRLTGLREDLLAAQEEMKLDSLTQIYNRRAFDMAIERCINVHYVVSQSISLVMIDVDNFKVINDRLGHAAGDDLLREVADRMSRSFVRKNDLICRFGGDEFAVILPETSAKQAAVSIERFLNSVRALQDDDWPADMEISCSAGCAEIEAGDDVESLLQRADKALYEAKQAGRNCLRIL